MDLIHLAKKDVEDQSDWALLEMVNGIIGMKPTTVTLDESDRQAIIMALANLAVSRPGWDYMLNNIALKMDRNLGGRAMMYEALKAIRQRYIVPDLAHKAMLLDSSVLTSLMKGEYAHEPIEQPAD